MAAFYNIESRFPNIFLAQTLHDVKCFCAQCRRRQINAVIDKSEANLRHMVTVNIPTEREARTSAVFEVTKKQIIYGKLYKDICLENTHLKYFKCSAKRQPAYQLLVSGDNARRKEFDRHCQHINEAAYCFENWERIVSNLTDRRIDSVDARSFSVRSFFLASNLDWCLEYNEKLRRKGGSRGDQMYSRDQIDGIFQHIVNTGILDDIEYDEQVAASIGSQLQRKMVSYCRKQR